MRKLAPALALALSLVLPACPLLGAQEALVSAPGSAPPERIQPKPSDPKTENALPYDFNAQPLHPALVRELKSRLDPKTRAPEFVFDENSGRILGPDGKPLSRERVSRLIAGFERERAQAQLSARVDFLVQSGRLDPEAAAALLRDAAGGSLPEARRASIRAEALEAGFKPGSSGSEGWKVAESIVKGKAEEKSGVAADRAYDGLKARAAGISRELAQALPAFRKSGSISGLPARGAVKPDLGRRRGRQANPPPPGGKSPSGPPRTREDWNQELAKAWTEALARTEATKEHAQFVKDHKVTFHVASDGKMRSVARYVGGKIYFNELHLEMGKLSLEDAGVEEKEIPGILAMKTLPIIAHEVRHGITLEALAKKAGMPLETAAIEDEVISFADQARVLARLEKEKPELAKHRLPLLDDGDKELLDAWASGPEGVELRVQRIYKLPSYLSESGEALAERYRWKQKAINEMATARETIANALARARTNEEKAELQERLDELPSEEDSRSYVRMADATVTFFSDLTRVDKLKEFYKERMGWIKEQWDGEEAKAWRAARAAAAPPGPVAPLEPPKLKAPKVEEPKK